MNTRRQYRRMLVLGAVVSCAFVATARAQSRPCLGDSPSIAVMDSVRTISRRLYGDLRGPRHADSVMVVALLLDADCRLVQHAHGAMAFPYSTRDAFEALFGRSQHRHMGLAGIAPMADRDTSDHRRVVFGIVADSVGR